MGLFSTKTKTTEKATTKPIFQPYTQAPVENYYNDYTQMYGPGGAADPSNFVVAPTAQQQAAFGATFSGSNPALNNAVNIASNTGPAGYALAPTAQGQVQKAGYALATTDKANTSLAQTAQGTAQTAAAPDRAILNNLALGQAQQAQQGQQAVAGTAGGSMASQFVDQYQPYATKALVDASMASFNDQAGRQKAEFAAKAGARNAFGGSGQALGEAQLRADLSRQGALTRAQLEDTALTRAFGMAAGDADRTTNAGIATAANQTSASVANANNDNSRNMFNTGQTNQFGLTQFNANNANNQLEYSTMADINKFNSNELNNMTGLNLQEMNRGNQFNAGLQTQNNQFNAGQTNDNNRFNAGTRTQASQFNAGEVNDMSQFNAGEMNNNNRFNADTFNNNSQFNANFGLNQATTLGNLGVAQGDYARNDALTNANLGGQQWAINQQNQLAPYTSLAMQGELLNPNGLLNLSTGQQMDSTGTSKKSGGLGFALLSAASNVGSAFAASERRVKRDIVKLGEESDGLGVYRYNYIWDEPEEMPRFGVMVDEVETIRPWALGPVIDGVQTVNYGAL